MAQFEQKPMDTIEHDTRITCSETNQMRWSMIGILVSYKKFYLLNNSLGRQMAGLSSFLQLTAIVQS